MDPVSLALGVVPLCLSALKGAKLAQSKIRLLKHHDRALSRLRKMHRTQILIFRDETQLLLQDAGVNNDLASLMAEDLDHEAWASSDIEGQLWHFLGKKYDEMQEVAREILEQVTEFSVALDCLDDSDEHTASRGKVAVTAYKARRAIKVASKLSTFEESVESLTHSVNEFRRLRKVAKGVQQSRLGYPKHRSSMPRTYALVAKHSGSFLETLSRSWSCLGSEDTHSTHTAKLLLDPDASDKHVDFRMILEHEAVLGAVRQHLLCLRIRSQEVTEVDISLLPPAGTPLMTSIEPAEPSASVRRVRFADQSATTMVATRRIERQTQGQLVNNLCHARDVCHHVFKHGKALHQSGQEGCIGYLVSADASFTHQLIAAQDKASTAIQTRSCPLATLASIVNPSEETNISLPEQLRLALRLAHSVLQYHSTPWWRRDWSLADLSYFSIDPELSTSLATLHIEAQLASKTPDKTTSMQSLLVHLPTTTSPSDDDTDDNDAKYLCGIRNVTLYSLGAALLQIGRWESLDTHDAATVRRIAERPSRLGPKYDELTARCLWCDFGIGGDLAQPALQRAMYEGVICELEQMVQLLETGLGG